MLENIPIILQNTIVYATPLILAALGGLYSEKTGVVNIALEGLMTIGAFTAAVVSIFSAEVLGLGGWSPWVGLISAMIAGMIFALPHAVASINFKADQVVSGVALNFLASGVTIFLLKQIFDGAAQTTPVYEKFQPWAIPGLHKIPIIGNLFNLYPISYIAFILVALSWILIYKTPLGLRMRAVGEHPRAADTMGVNVYKIRYFGVIMSGAFAALGGAAVSTAIINEFSSTTIAGQGFIGLAALIFGKWHPTGAMGAALFFGLANALAASGQTIGLTNYVPSEFLNSLPYILTVLALAGLVGKTVAPAADGKPYEKGER